VEEASHVTGRAEPHRATAFRRSRLGWSVLPRSLLTIVPHYARAPTICRVPPSAARRIRFLGGAPLSILDGSALFGISCRGATYAVRIPARLNVSVEMPPCVTDCARRHSHAHSPQRIAPAAAKWLACEVRPCMVPRGCVWVPPGAPDAKISPAAASPSPLVLGSDLLIPVKKINSL
jgi:hypothetical protein